MNCTILCKTESETVNLCRICSENGEVTAVIENVSIRGVKLVEILKVQFNQIDWENLES